MYLNFVSFSRTYPDNFISLLLGIVSEFLVLLLHEPLDSAIRSLLQLILVLPRIRLTCGKALPVRVEQVYL